MFKLPQEELDAIQQDLADNFDADENMLDTIMMLIIVGSSTVAITLLVGLIAFITMAKLAL